MTTTYCLKIDVDTHRGMREGVPRLLSAFRQFNVKATFFLSFGPDNSGKAIWNVLRNRGFAKKMVKTSAVKLYGWRTILSGTVLPARMIATRFPDLVRQIVDEGHEAGVHAWDHRLWQDHLQELGYDGALQQLMRACAAYEHILRQPAKSTAAPAWAATASSLRAQDTLGLTYSSDTRGNQPGFPELDGYSATTLQIPTTQPCLEELLAQGIDDPKEWVAQVLGPALSSADRRSGKLPLQCRNSGTGDQPQLRVIPLHAEVEGGIYADFLQTLLLELCKRGNPVITMEAAAQVILKSNPSKIKIELRELPGRATRVATVI
jgi:undecaprenyl phosphate-alpha-L-ara4FN deformylase